MIEIIAWLCALILATVALAAVAAFLAWGGRSRYVLAVAGALSAIIWCVAGTDAVAWSSQNAGIWLPAWKYFAVTGTSLVVLAHLAGTWCLVRSSTDVVRRATGGLACIWLLGMSAWAAYRLFSLTSAVPVDVIETPYAVSIREAEGIRLRTDAGRELSVYVPANPEIASQCADESLQSLDDFLIREAPADIRSNCFGWVFTGGEYIVLDDAAKTILDDNGYVPVTTPQAGDLIVYRDRLQALVHIGVVRCVLDDGTPLIESKWGPGGRFLHRPLHQIYSDTYTYLRSPRRAEEPLVSQRHLMTQVSTASEAAEN